MKTSHMEVAELGKNIGGVLSMGIFLIWGPYHGFYISDVSHAPIMQFWGFHRHFWKFSGSRKSQILTHKPETLNPHPSTQHYLFLSLSYLVYNYIL